MLTKGHAEDGHGLTACHEWLGLTQYVNTFGQPFIKLKQPMEDCASSAMCIFESRSCFLLIALPP
jgi:hypothetical protein